MSPFAMLILGLVMMAAAARLVARSSAQLGLSVAATRALQSFALAV